MPVIFDLFHALNALMLSVNACLSSWLEYCTGFSNKLMLQIHVVFMKISIM